jgi:DNA/RNA endonuclease YhcR with UshA esterase domain
VSHCPSCGQFVGPRGTCPHCGAHIGGRMTIRVIKIAAVVVTVVGLLFLWLLAGRATVSTVSIGQVGATTNLAYVRLEGWVPRGPSFDSDSHTLTFWLADDTGEIYVAAYRRQAEELLASGCVPTVGDRVSVVGTLRVREDFASLTINAAEQVTVTKPEPSDRSVAEIDPYSELERVRLRGQLRDVRSPYEGLTLIGLRDATGVIEVAVPEETLILTGDLPALSPGQMVAVEGTVTFYKETPQLTLTDVADVVLLTEPFAIAPLRLASEIGAALVGNWVGLQGFITDVALFSAGARLTLDDGSGEVTVLLWQDLYDELLAATTPEEGAGVTVYGQVAEYRGQLELIPELPVDVQLTAAPLPPERRAIGTLTEGDVGRRVQLGGTLGEPDHFSAGVKFALDDGTGQITLLLWQQTYDQVVATQVLKAGAGVSVAGEVAEYRGELEIIPRRAADVTVRVEAAFLPTGTPSPTPAPLPTDTPAPTPTFQVFCTPPPCKEDEVYYCPDDCPGGCGTECATPTPAPTDTPTPTLVVATTSLGEIDAGRVGETLTVRGQVADAASFAAGFKLILDDGTGQIVLVLWNEVYDAVDDVAGLNVGATVQLTGKIGEYEAELQITPADASEVTVLAPGDGPDAPRREIGSLSAADVGTLVEIEGDVSRVESFSSGLRVYVTDGSGEVQLLLWQNVAERLPQGEKLVAGARVRAVGQVGEYKGTLQVVPRLPFDLAVLTD